MPAAADSDSDNESVLSSLPSSPPAEEQDRDEEAQLSLSEGDEDEDENDKAAELRDESDAETEPLPPTSSAARARHGRTAGPSKRRAILQTGSSSSGGEDGNAGDGRRRRDTLTVPSGSTQLTATHSPKSRRMSFDDGSDLSALTSDAEDAHFDEDGDNDDEEGQGNEDGGPTPRAARTAHASTAGSKRKVIEQTASTRNNDREDSFDNDDNGDESASMDEEADDGEDDDDEDENENDDDDDEDDENVSSSGKHGRGRGRPPKRQNALAAAAKRAAARTSSQGIAHEEDDSEVQTSTGGLGNTKAEPLEDNEDDEELKSAPHAGSISLTAKTEQLDGYGMSGLTNKSDEDDAEGLDPDEQLEQDMMADEAAELAKAARALDDSDDGDYMDPSGSKSRSQQQQHTSARRRGQIHSGTAKNAARRTIPGSGARDGSASLPSSASKPPLSPSSRNTGKAPNSASSTGGAHSSGKKRGGSIKRGAAGRAAAAALRQNSSAARMETEDDEDGMDVDSQARMSEENSDSDPTPRKDKEARIGKSAQITVTDVNGKTEHGEGSFMSGSAMSLPGSVAAQAALSAVGLDRDVGMSGASDDVPILLRATEQAQARAQAAAASASASTSTIPRLSVSTTAAQAGMPSSRETATSEDETAPSTPLLPLPLSDFVHNSAARKASPASETRGRGRGRGGRGAWGRGRGKKLAQARMLAAHADDDDVLTSAAEDGQDRDGSPGHETGAGSDHDEGDAGAAKKRQEAIEALTKIEIEFAQLRDKMYLEKMEEVAKERWQIENDVHPEHIHLMHLVEHRRMARLELTKKNYKVAEEANLRRAESDVRYCWSQWMRRRHDLIRDMVDDMNQKRRRLDREKRAIERPRNEELATILRMHAPPPYMFYEKKNPLTYGREYSLEYEVAENMQKKRKRGAAGLDHDEAMYDLERMGLRDPYRKTYPPHYHYDPAYAVGPQSAGPTRLYAAPKAQATNNFHNQSIPSTHPWQQY